MANPTCVICLSTTGEIFATGARSTYRLRVNCDTCGRYAVTSAAHTILSQLEDRTLCPYLSAHVRQMTDAAVEEVLITEDNWQELARGHIGVPVSQKIRRLLEYVASRTTTGEWLHVPHRPRLVAALDMKHDEELQFVLRHVGAQGLIQTGNLGGHSNGQGGFTDTHLGLLLTVTGWEAVAPAIGGTAGTCFVAMSFDPSLQQAYDVGIMPAILDAGFTGGRVDHVPHNDNITDRIRARIRAAQFVIADFTLHRQGVYYEAGFAEGLGRAVIRTCRSDHFDGLHFDTRQFFHLQWTTPADLRIALADHVRATIGIFGHRS